jgi:ribonuclease HI
MATLAAFKLAIECNLYETTPVTIYSDSAYVVNIVNDWIWSWAKNNWMNSKKKTVENLDLVKILYNYLTTNFFQCQVVKIPGHSDIVENEFADALATGNTKKALDIVAKNPQKFENFKNL